VSGFSLVKAIATEFNLTICVINIHRMNDDSLSAALAKTPPNSVVLLEDFETVRAASDRKGPDFKPSESSASRNLTLTGLLNALDGMVPLDDCIIFLTTNHLDKVDEAIYRKGRVDYTIEIGDVDPSDVRSYAKVLYPNYNFDDVEFQTMTGCDIHEAFLEGKESPQRFLSYLNR